MAVIIRKNGNTEIVDLKGERLHSKNDYFPGLCAYVDLGQNNVCLVQKDIEQTKTNLNVKASITTGYMIYGDCMILSRSKLFARVPHALIRKYKK